MAGSLLGNSFVVGRMTVAAGHAKWLPGFLALVGRLGTRSDSGTAQGHPPDDEAPLEAPPKPSDSDAPLNALVLSTVLTTLYIFLGNFRALLTFNGLGEYSFFFLTVLGAIILRFRDPDLHRPYKPFLLVPVVFAIVSGFVVVRGAVFAPVPAIVLVTLWAVGLGFYWSRRWWSGVA